jgi:hypothetical protein
VGFAVGRKAVCGFLAVAVGLRLMTYRSLIAAEPLTIRTTRPVVPAFQEWLDRWGVTVESP